MYFNKVKFGIFVNCFPLAAVGQLGVKRVIYQALKRLSKFCICENDNAYKEP